VKFFRGKYEATLEFPEGVGVNQKPSVGWVWIFSGTAHCNQCYHSNEIINQPIIFSDLLFLKTQTKFRQKSKINDSYLIIRIMGPGHGGLGTVFRNVIKELSLKSCDRFMSNLE